MLKAINVINKAIWWSDSDSWWVGLYIRYSKHQPYQAR